MKVCVGILFFFVCVIINTELFSASSILDIIRRERDKRAPAVDHGYGPGAPLGPPRPNLVLGKTPIIPRSILSQRSIRGAAAKAGSAGTAGGLFGPAFPWPIIPIHIALLPDGRVLSFGTDQNGSAGDDTLIYDIWDPKLGNGTDAHTILPNTTSTNIFCSAGSLLPSGKLLISGGDLTVGGVQNFANNKVNIFNPKDNTLAAAGQMNYPRWYPSMTTLPNGDKLVLGGLFSPSEAEPTPEVRSPGYGWRTLPGISISGTDEWFYPRGLVGIDNWVYLLEHNGNIFRLNTSGTGTMQDTGSLMAPGKASYPSVMFSPFKALMVRANQRVQVVDISSNPPVVTDLPDLSYDRIWGGATLLPDGEVLVSGGSGVDNELTNVAYQVEIYNPDLGTWTLGASASIPRLYHSSTLLLPDGSVLTGGGGAPGPVNELNAEIYYPDYLFLNDGSGNPALRPTIVSAPSTLNLNQSFLVTVGANDTISTINLVRMGVNTHTFNPEERLIPVPFSQRGTQITATLNRSAKSVPPGYYMLFAFNSSGVPAVAKIISVPVQPLPDLIPTSLSYSSATGIFTSVVKNRGAAATPAGVIVGVTYSVDGGRCTWGAVNGPLAAGASVTIGSDGGPCPIASGTHRISIFANKVNRIVESNETNNKLSQTITISP